MKFDTKIAIVVRKDLHVWQKLNVTAFLMSGISGTQDVIGKPYNDMNGVEYLPMSKQPILIFGADKEEIKKAHEKALKRELNMSIYIEELFETYNDEDNRKVVSKYKTGELNLVGIGLSGKKNHVDKVLKGLSLHP